MMTRWQRRALWVVGSLAALVVLLTVASFFIDEPALEQIELGAFEPVPRQLNLTLRKGVLFGKGKVEYAPHVKIVHLEEVRLDGFDGDLVHTAGGPEKKVARAAGSAAEQVSNQPDVLVRVDRALVRKAYEKVGQVVAKLIENAFFKAILPGFEQVARGGRGRDRDRHESGAASPR